MEQSTHFYAFLALWAASSISYSVVVKPSARDIKEVVVALACSFAVAILLFVVLSVSIQPK